MNVKPKVTARYWAIYDAIAEKVIHGKHQNARRECASLTKMMTCLVALNLLERLNLTLEDEVYIDDLAIQLIGTSACLIEGHSLTINQLLYAMMLPSGNDAAFALANFFGQLLYEEKAFDDASPDAQFISYKIELGNFIQWFIREMNHQARRMGMRQTNFDSVHGMANANNFSTASEMAMLASHCMKNTVFRNVVKAQKFICKPLNDPNHVYEWQNTNFLLDDPQFNGCKTGVTEVAGPCLASSYCGDDPDSCEYIIILLAARSMEDRWQDTR